jgi:hypothetical protein
MKYKIILFLLITSLKSIAQQNTIASGNSVSNSNGSISYSIGQIDYLNVNNQNGNLNQGIQQPFEIFNITSLNTIEGLNVSIFPNPTTSLINIESEYQNLSIRISDISGQLLEEKNNFSDKIISFENYSQGTYILTITNKDNKISNYKIIKNK